MTKVKIMARYAIFKFKIYDILLSGLGSKTLKIMVVTA
jgi:hypothetical protein